MSIINAVKQTAIETVWPTRCVICDKHGALLCKSCFLKIQFIDTNSACPICGEPFGINQCCGCSPVHANLPEEERDNYRMDFDRCISVTTLDEYTGKIVTIYKDAGERRLAKVIAYFMHHYIELEQKNNKTIVTYIPATKEAITRRGFDHARLIAKNFAKSLNARCVCLLNSPESKDQRQLGRHSREENMKDQFSILDTEQNQKIAHWCDNVILIDDVYTTGATLNSASKTLRNFGFRQITCITFSRSF